MLNDDNVSWQGMSRCELNAAYNNSAAVVGSDEIVADWSARSAVMRTEYVGHLDLRYGGALRNTIDYFSAGDNTPMLVFFPGGNWQSLSKDDFTFAARGPLAHGISVALVGYTLAPQATLDVIVEQCRQALTFVRERLLERDNPHQSLWIAGWSAGAHIAAMVLDTVGINGGLVISGVYDLEPIRHSYINDKLGLSATAADRNSPALHIPAHAPELWVVAGQKELSEWRRQSRVFAERRAAAGLPGGHFEIEDTDHFTIMGELAHPKGQLSSTLIRLIEARGNL